jgi:hypothetical protein
MTYLLQLHAPWCLALTLPSVSKITCAVVHKDYYISMTIDVKLHIFTNAWLSTPRSEIHALFWDLS